MIKTIQCGLFAGVLATTMLVCPPAAQAADGPVIDHQLTTINGKTLKMNRLRGKAVLIVNTASKCGYTPQLEGLQELHEKFKERGLVVIGVPSNDFGQQEPGTHDEIQAFCKKNYGVTFPLTEKTKVTGEDKSPLYTALTERTPDGIKGEVEWNFTKFLLDTDGRVVARFPSKTTPMSAELVAAVEAALPSS